MRTEKDEMDAHRSAEDVLEQLFTAGPAEPPPAGVERLDVALAGRVAAGFGSAEDVAAARASARTRQFLEQYWAREAPSTALRNRLRLAGREDYLALVDELTTPAPETSRLRVQLPPQAAAYAGPLRTTDRTTVELAVVSGNGDVARLQVRPGRGVSGVRVWLLEAPAHGTLRTSSGTELTTSAGVLLDAPDTELIEFLTEHLEYAE